MKRLPVCLLPALLTACVPSLTEQPRLTATARLEGRDLLVTVTNHGPFELLLENTCPVPFPAGFGTSPFPGQSQTCLTQALAPEVWPVGQSRTAHVTVGLFGRGLPAGTHTLNAWAEPRVKLLQQGWQVGTYRKIRVQAPPLTVTLP